MYVAILALSASTVRGENSYIKISQKVMVFEILPDPPSRFIYFPLDLNVALYKKMHGCLTE